VETPWLRLIKEKGQQVRSQSQLEAIFLKAGLRTF
jgi:hypothetical protein